MNLINNTEELQQACKILKKQKIIAIDSEFIREKTYYPIPCLIQVGYEGGAFVIDALAEDMDWSDFFALMQNKKILKVFHSGRQDIEIIYNLMGAVPVPVFDTQIAAQVCGLGESISYENLVRTYCGVELDKSCRLTNWQIRPLSAEQLEYAAGDVTHLVHCYKKISAYLKESKRESWIVEELADLSDISHYEQLPENAWLRIRHNGHSLAFLNALKALAEWREKKAAKSNLSRQSIIKDEALVNIATAFPRNMDEMKNVRGLRPDIAKGRLAKEMVDVLSSLTEDKYDKSLLQQEKEKETTLPPSLHSLCEVLKLLLKIKSNDFGVVSRLITSEKNLRDYIRNPKVQNQILKGWRYEVFGKTAEEFRQGRLGIVYDATTRDIIVKEIS